MGSCYFCAGGFDLRVGTRAELFVKGETDGLDGDVGAVRLLEERTEEVVSRGIFGFGGLEMGLGGCVPEDTRRDVTTTANGDHKVRLELIEDLVCCLLAELVDLEGGRTSAAFCVFCLLDIV